MLGLQVLSAGLPLWLVVWINCAVLRTGTFIRQFKAILFGQWIICAQHPSLHRKIQGTGERTVQPWWIFLCLCRSVRAVFLTADQVLKWTLGCRVCVGFQDVRQHSVGVHQGRRLDATSSVSPLLDAGSTKWSIRGSSQQQNNSQAPDTRNSIVVWHCRMF